MPWTLPLFALSMALTIAVFPFSSHPVVFGNIMEAVALATAAVNLTLTASSFKRNDAPRKAWMRLAIGMWIWIIAQFMGMYWELIVNKVSYGTLGDTFWVIGYLLWSAVCTSLSKTTAAQDCPWEALEVMCSRIGPACRLRGPVLRTHLGQVDRS